MVFKIPFVKSWRRAYSIRRDLFLTGWHRFYVRIWPSQWWKREICGVSGLGYHKHYIAVWGWQYEGEK